MILSRLVGERRLSWLLVWCVGGLPLAAPAAGTQTPRPNIILITVDTFRPDHLGYYGYPRDTSPHLDAFSREGVFFKQAFSTSGWTTPGLISILTSLYAPTHGVDLRGRRLAPGVVTLPDALRAAGYRAPDIFFLTVLPNFENLGFEPYAKRVEYIDRGNEVFFKWLEEEGRGERPFFLYYHYRDLHLPYNPGEAYESMFMPAAYRPGGGLLSGLRRFLVKEKMAAVKRNVMLVRGAVDFGAADSQWVRALYDGEIRRMDEELFGPLRRLLAERDLGRNTLVVVSADHGEELLDHGLVGHVSTFKEGRLYDEITRIPLIFWLPGALPAGRVIEQPVQCIDLMPTVLDLLDLPASPQAQGRSLLPLMEGGQGPRRPLFFETSGGGYTASAKQYRQRYRAVRTQRWKLIYDGPEDDYALYDLAADPGERRDVKEAHPAVGDSLLRLLNEWVLYAGQRPHEPVVGAVGVVGADTAGWAGAPRIAFPGDGDTLYYQGVDHAIRPRWSGPTRADYTVEYEVGTGAYHLEGVMTVAESAPEYGPFREDFWNSLVLYNPWKFRVYLLSQPEQKSEWVTFHLASTAPGESGFSMLGLLLRARFVLAETVDQAGKFAWGMGLGLVDLGLWLGQVPAADLSAGALLVFFFGAVLWPLVRRWGVERCRSWGGWRCSTSGWSTARSRSCPRSGDCWTGTRKALFAISA